MRSSLRALVPSCRTNSRPSRDSGSLRSARRLTPRVDVSRPAHLRRQPVLEGIFLSFWDCAGRQVGLRHRESHLQLLDLPFDDLDPLVGGPEQPLLAQARLFLRTDQLPTCLLQLLEKLRVLRGGLCDRSSTASSAFGRLDLGRGDQRRGGCLVGLFLVATRIRSVASPAFSSAARFRQLRLLASVCAVCRRAVASASRSSAALRRGVSFPTCSSAACARIS